MIESQESLNGELNFKDVARSFEAPIYHDIEVSTSFFGISFGAVEPVLEVEDIKAKSLNITEIASRKAVTVVNSIVIRATSLIWE